MAAVAGPFFTLADLPPAELTRIVAGTPSQPPADRIELAAGDAAWRELAIPFLTGMDRIRVEAAELGLRVASYVVDSTTHSVRSGSGDEQGVIVDLGSSGRLASVELGPIAFPASVTSQATRYEYRGIRSREGGTTVKTLRLVVRPAEPFGPPLFADADFDPPGPMFDRVLSGLSVTVNTSTKKIVVHLPKLAGRAWLFQLAHGDEPTELTSIPFSAAVGRVTVDSAPENLSVVLAGFDGDVVLFNHPGALPPDVHVHDVSFTPLAQRHLQVGLAPVEPVPATLPVRLRFEASSPGALEIPSKQLRAHYEADPLEAAPASVALRGRWTRLLLNVPAGRRPYAVAGELTLRHLGRELNGPEAPPGTPAGHGVRISKERWGAASIAWEPAPGSSAPTLPLASAALHLVAAEASEIVLELREDAAGAPGAEFAPAVVRQLPAGSRDWIDFELHQAVPVETGRRLWLVLRSNQGEVLWSAGGVGQARVSLDRGRTWAGVNALLTDPADMLVQLFHAVSSPPPPIVRARLGDAVVSMDVLGALRSIGPGEYAAVALALPPAMLDALAQPGSGRRATELFLFSRAAADLVAHALTLSYNPFGEA
jgi:hypothetical protein